MSKPTDIAIKATRSQFFPVDFRVPIKFGGRIVTAAVIARAEVDVETRDGRRATGEGEMPLGNVWAWPSKVVAGEQSLQAMQQLAADSIKAAGEYNESGHPLEITHALSTEYDTLAAQVTAGLGIEERMPPLAQLVSASPLEAAIFDAYGKVLGQNSYNVLGEEYCNADLSYYLNDEFRGEYLDQYTLRKPKSRMPLYHLVGALDPLTDADVESRVNDGLPETLPEWIAADGLTHMKIKLAGDDFDWDIHRVVAIDRVATEAQTARGCDSWFYSVDFNEKCASVQYVLDFLAKVQQEAPQAFDRIEYIEQPTSRDLRANPENKMHQAAKIKPVVIDESLDSFQSLLLSQELGYSGVALKACKGQSEALLMGAAAQKYKMFLCVQDLTCIGISFLHSATLSARIPTVAAIEANGRQYAPAGNREMAKKFPSMFEVTDGSLGTAVLDGNGLGYY